MLQTCSHFPPNKLISVQSDTKVLRQLKFLSATRAEQTAEVLGQRSPLFDANLSPIELRSISAFHQYIEKLSAGRPNQWFSLRDLATLKNLESLKLADCAQLQDSSMRHLSPLTKLSCLVFNGCSDLSDSFLTCLLPLRQLKHLSLGGCCLTNRSIDSLRLLPKLQFLYLGDVQALDDEAARELGRHMSQLKWLSLDSTSVTDAGVASLASLTQLELLDLARTRITGSALQHLPALPALKSLDLSCCLRLGSEAVEHLSECKQLTSLNLEVRCASFRPLHRVSPVSRASLFMPACAGLLGPGR